MSSQHNNRKIMTTTTSTAQPSIFKKYSSIENHYQQDFLDKVILANDKYTATTGTELEWVACEKVHGANFSFIVTQEEVSYAKRTSILTSSDKFYPEGLTCVVNKYTECARRMFTLFTEEFLRIKVRSFQRLDQVSIFGELFGGAYANPKGDRRPIQSGVYYAEDYEFYAFDVHVRATALNEDDKSPKEVHVWLSFDEAADLFEKSGFTIYAKPLIRGKLRDVLELNVEFDSTIPSTFFPQLAPKTPGTNICEGVIIRPANNTLYLPSRDRAIIKKKNASFMEKNAAPQPKDKQTQEEQVRLSDEGLKAWDEMELYITEQRLNSCESKHGHLERANVGKLAGMLSKDVLEDFLKEFPDLWASVKKEDQKKLTKRLSERCKSFSLKILRQQQEQQDS